ncbi:hypothetical protein [Actinoplanes sp. NPDC023714]|uniref:LppU/SCO3897 family protein n=1 Tax=Actinoplanes sp. NPDC023714 TaxID=3154322 RepID=UPI00340EF7D2
MPQPRDAAERPAVGSARPVTASASVPGSRVEANELPPPAPAPQARVYGRPAAPAEPETGDDDQAGDFPDAPFAAQRAEAPFGVQQPESFAPQQAEPFAPQQAEPFAPQQPGSPYGSPQQDSPFGAPQQDSPFGGQQQDSPFGGPQQGEAPFGQQGNQVFGGQQADSPFAQRRGEDEEPSGGFQQDRFTPPGSYPAGSGFPQQPGAEENGQFDQRPGDGGPFGQRPGEGGPFGQRPGEGGPFGQRPGEGGPFGQRPGEGGPFGQRAEDGPGDGGPFGPRPGDGGPFGPRPGEMPRSGEGLMPGDGSRTDEGSENPRGGTYGGTYGQRAEENVDNEPSGGFAFPQRDGSPGTPGPFGDDASGGFGVNPQSPARASARASASARVSPPDAPPFPGSGGAPYSMPGSPQFPSSGGPAFGGGAGAPGPDQFSEHTTDLSGRGNSTYVPAPALPPMPGETPPGVYPGSPAARATVTPPGPEDTTSWPGPAEEQNRFDSFKAEEPAAPAPVKTNVKTIPVTLAVVLGATLLLGIVFGLVYLISGDDEFSVAQGECVTRTSENTPVKADCSTKGAFEVVSIAAAKEQCADQSQPYIVVPKDGGDQVLCLKPRA